MKYKTITIVSEIENDMQAWTFSIETADLFRIMEKYCSEGFSIRGDIEDITSEIKEIYK